MDNTTRTAKLARIESLRTQATACSAQGRHDLANQATNKARDIERELERAARQ